MFETLMGLLAAFDLSAVGGVLEARRSVAEGGRDVLEAGRRVVEGGRDVLEAGRSVG